VKLNENENVPSPAPEGGKCHVRILSVMQRSVSAAPAPDHVRFVTFTAVTPPVGVSATDAVTEPASDGFSFSPYSL